MDWFATTLQVPIAGWIGLAIVSFLVGRFLGGIFTGLLHLWFWLRARIGGGK